MPTYDLDFLNHQQRFLQDLIGFKKHPTILEKEDALGFSDWNDAPLAIFYKKDMGFLLMSYLLLRYMNGRKPLQAEIQSTLNRDMMIFYLI